MERKKWLVVFTDNSNNASRILSHSFTSVPQYAESILSLLLEVWAANPLPCYIFWRSFFNFSDYTSIDNYNWDCNLTETGQDFRLES